MNEMFLYLIPGSGIVALLFVYLKNNWVTSVIQGLVWLERMFSAGDCRTFSLTIIFPGRPSLVGIKASNSNK